jgi:ectoine hydroxylase-related dioxygenase (phytanoyl-CoA dioxygenase family)
MDKGVAYPFSALVGVALTDTPTADAGQLTVFPGSHGENAALIAARGEAALFGQNAPRPALAARPVELRLEAGDAVFAHPLLAHRIGINFTGAVRHALFFRVTHADREPLRARLLGGDLFAELDV